MRLNKLRTTRVISNYKDEMRYAGNITVIPLKMK